MNTNSDQLDRSVTRVLAERFDDADEPQPWSAVMERATEAPLRSAEPSSSPARRRWPLVAASLLLAVAGVAALSTIVRDSDPAVSELPPPSLDSIVLDGVGPTRPLSSLAEGEVAVPTVLFRDLALQPLVLEDAWESSWVAHRDDGVRRESDVDISVRTSSNAGEINSPDFELSAGGVDWAVWSFGPAFHNAFVRLGDGAVSVSVQGVALGDLEALLDGLRAGEPDAHAAWSYDSESDGRLVARSSDGQYSLEAGFVGEWLCSTTHVLRQLPLPTSCVIPEPGEDDSMVIQSVARGLAAEGGSSDIDDPQRVTVFTAGFVSVDAIGANIAHVDDEIVFALAEDLSGDFDVRFFLGVHELDELIGSDPVDMVGLDAVAATAVFDS